MATYYCNASGTWAPAQDGTDNTGSEWQGPYGLQKAFDTVTAGNNLHVKGTADLGRLVSMTLGKDVGAAGWTAGDAIQNDTGDGDDWTGVLCEVSGSDIVAELASGKTYDDVNTADGIENTTQTDSTTISTKTINQMWIDTQTGDGTNGFIKYIGVNSSWVIDGTQAIINASSGTTKATVCLNASVGTIRWLWFENFEIKNASNDNVTCNNNNDYWTIINCDFHSAGDVGFAGASGNNWFNFINCRFYNNGGEGIYAGAMSHFLMCCAYGNASHGIYCYGNDNIVIYGSALFDNGDSSANAWVDCGAVCVNSVFDGTNQASETGVRTYNSSSVGTIVLMCRITNCATGFDNTSGENFHGWNLYHNNTADTANDGTLYAIPHNSDADTNEYGDVDDGYNNASNKDYNLKESRTYNGDGNDVVGLGIGS